MNPKRFESARRTQRLAIYSAAGAAAVAQLGHAAIITGGPNSGTGTTASTGAWTYNQIMLSSGTIGLDGQFRLAPKLRNGATTARYRVVVASGVANSMQFLARGAGNSVANVITANGLGNQSAQNLGNGDKLATNASICATGNWQSVVAMNFGERRPNSWSRAYGPTSAPPWTTSNASGSTRGYLGFRFKSSGTWLYGWMDVEISSSGSGQNTMTIQILSWAYDNTGQCVMAGVSSPSSVPGGACLAALAFGAAGLRGRRRSGN